MKTTCIIFALLVAARANPIFQSEEVGEEFVPVAEHDQEDWQLVPDADGKMHLVDINSLDVSVEPLFNAPTDIVVRLWTRQNTGAGQIVQINNNAQLASSNFVASRLTVFHFHGWNGGGATTGAAIRAATLAQHDANVFVFDWGVGAQKPNYVAARNRVDQVGAHGAAYSIWLNSHGVPYSNMISIGHSLGAHCAGHHGKRTPALMQAVIGLDAAGPLFSLDVPTGRIHATEAVNVQCIVTDANRLGFQHPVCNTNFYPNWGTSQPGCGIDLTGACGHERVNPLVAATFNPANNFASTLCGTTLAPITNRSCPSVGAGKRMGGLPLFAGPNPSGRVFFLPTTGTAPFVSN